MSLFDGSQYAKRPLPDPDRDLMGKHQRPGAAAETQIGAARLATPRTGTQRRKVLDCIIVSEGRGMTDEEIQLALDMNPSTERPRRVELTEEGWIEDSGMRRLTRAKVRAVVWVLTIRAQRELGWNV